MPGSPGTLSPTVLELTLPVRLPQVLRGSLYVMFAVPGMGRMGKVQGSSCQGREEWSQGGQGLAQPSWVVNSSRQTGLSSQTAQCCLQGHPQKPHSLLSPLPGHPAGSGAAPGLPMAILGPTCLPSPLVPHLTKARPCCHEPKGSFYPPPPPAQ